MASDEYSEVELTTGKVKNIPEGPLKGFKVLTKGDKYSVLDPNGNEVELPEFPSKLFLKKTNDIYRFYAMWEAKNPTIRLQKKAPF